MSDCNKISELLSAYIDGEVTEKEKSLVENHISECTSCKQKLDMMQKTKDILKATPPIPVPETLLKDFEEYREKSEKEEEKKVVPFYKNYRVYASIAAVFIFAFVLKSGLWQEDKFVPDELSQTPVTEQTITAPVDKGAGSDETVGVREETDDTAVVKGETENKNQVKVAPQKTDKVAENTNQPNIAPEVQNDTPPQQETYTELTNEVNSVYDNSQDAAPLSLARTSDATENEAETETSSEGAEESRQTEADLSEEKETAVATHAIVYVAQEHLDKAARLLSEGTYFYAQVEQKLNDNRIPFESNFLSLDEGIPHKVVVMVKE